MVAEPLVGRSSPTRILMKVVLPAPLGPRKPRICPRSSSMDRSSSARNVPYFLVSPLASRTTSPEPMVLSPVGERGALASCCRLEQGADAPRSPCCEPLLTVQRYASQRKADQGVTASSNLFVRSHEQQVSFWWFRETWAPESIFDFIPLGCSAVLLSGPFHK